MDQKAEFSHFSVAFWSTFFVYSGFIELKGKRVFRSFFTMSDKTCLLSLCSTEPRLAGRRENLRSYGVVSGLQPKRVKNRRMRKRNTLSKKAAYLRTTYSLFLNQLRFLPFPFANTALKDRIPTNFN